MNVQKIPYPNNGGPKPDGDSPRVETGAVQFGNDWPGLFIRGDQAMLLARNLRKILNNPAELQNVFVRGELTVLMEIIQEEVVCG